MDNRIVTRNTNSQLHYQAFDYPRLWTFYRDGADNSAPENSPTTIYVYRKPHPTFTIFIVSFNIHSVNGCRVRAGIHLGIDD